MTGADPRPLGGRVALVTGGSRGIGAATVRELARLGARVAVNHRNSREAATAVLDEVRAAGGEGMVIQGDVRESAAWELMARQVREQLGPVGILVGNAAMSFPRGSFREMAWEDFHAKLAGELKAAFCGVQALLPQLVEAGDGCVVLVSSALARTVQSGFVAHGTAKAALTHFGRYLAGELGPVGIRVQVVSPGMVQTERTATLPQDFRERLREAAALRRLALPEDVARVIGGLVRPEAAFLTGTDTLVDGGTLLGG
ncbi:MAG: SDR family oxidoreductase [Thermaerobacter sp.]|nr:SDR family oxidoreductase [Thermaerobacter sp.]